MAETQQPEEENQTPSTGVDSAEPSKNAKEKNKVSESENRAETIDKKRKKTSNEVSDVVSDNTKTTSEGEKNRFLIEKGVAFRQKEERKAAKDKLKEVEESRVHKEIDLPKQSIFSQLKENTELLTLNDIWLIFKHWWDTLSENEKFNAEYRRGRIEQKLGGGQRDAGVDQVNKSQGEIVDTLKKRWENLNGKEIKEIMYTSGDKIVVYAAIEALADRGLLQMDSVKLAQVLNKFGARVRYPDSNKVKVDQFLVMKMLDNIYGVGTGTKIRGSVDSNYKPSNFEDLAESLRLKKNGLQNRLHGLLNNFMAGKYVDPAEFEGILKYMMEKVKGKIEEQMYFLIQGLGAVNPSNETLLTTDRVLKISSGIGSSMPLIIMFKARADKLANFEYFQGLATKTKLAVGAGNKINMPVLEKYIYDEMLDDDATRTIVSDALDIGNSKIDRDVIELYQGVMNSSKMESFIHNKGSGKFAFPEVRSFAFGLTSFGKHIGYLTDGYNSTSSELYDNDDKEKFVDRITNAFASFAKLEGSLSNTYHKNKESYIHGSGRSEIYNYNNHNLEGEKSVSAFAESMYKTMGKVVDMYRGEDGWEELNDMYLTLQTGELHEKGVNLKKTVGSKGQAVSEKVYTEKIDEIYNSKFLNALNSMVKRDKGARMIAAINENRPLGYKNYKD